MADALREASNVEPMPNESSAGVVLNGHYTAPPKDKDGKVWARATALIQGNANELYTLWRNVEAIPKWQEMVTDVIATGEKTSHWVMKSDDKTLEWDSEILADEPNKRITWKSIGGDVEQAGEVVFDQAPGGRGTIVTVLQEFRQGTIATATETLFARNPKQAVIENLRHFKAFAETGEIPRIEGQPHGPRGLSGKMKAAAYAENVDAPPGETK